MADERREASRSARGDEELLERESELSAIGDRVAAAVAARAASW